MKVIIEIDIEKAAMAYNLQVGTILQWNLIPCNYMWFE